MVTDNGASFTGVAVISGTGNRITQNSINGNGGLGIDLNDDGVDTNDLAGSAGPADSDGGANGTQNYPDLTSATRDGTSITVGYDFNAAPGQDYTIEFFKSPACDSSGHGEGETYLGADSVTVGGGGLPTSFTSNIATPAAGSVVSGDSITATATDPAGNTSEFSTCAVAVYSARSRSASSALRRRRRRLWRVPPTVKLTDVPPSLFFDAAGALGSAPVGSIPVGSIPVGSIPVGSIPVGSIPVGSIGLTATQSLLSSIALSTIPLAPPSSWATVYRHAARRTAAAERDARPGARKLDRRRPPQLVPVGSINLSRRPSSSWSGSTRACS